MLQQHAQLRQQLAASETHSTELEAHEQELLSQLSSREAELLSMESRLSREQAAQADTRTQLQMVRHVLLVAAYCIHVLGFMGQKVVSVQHTHALGPTEADGDIMPCCAACSACC